MQILREQAALEQDAPPAPPARHARASAPDVQTAEFQLDSSDEEDSSGAYDPGLAQRAAARAGAATYAAPTPTPAPAPAPVAAEPPQPVLTTRLSYSTKPAEPPAAAAAAPKPVAAPQVDLLGMDGPTAAAPALAVADVADVDDFFAGGPPAAAAPKPAAVQSPDDLDSFFSGGASSSRSSSRPAAAAARPAAASSSKPSTASGLSLEQLARQQVVLPGNVNVSGYTDLYDDKEYQGGGDEPEVRRLLREKRLAERNAKMMAALQVRGGGWEQGQAGAGGGRPAP
jgi:hypothetical protein